jgi:hypothetical protein
MDRSRVKFWAPRVSHAIQGLERFDAYTYLHGFGFEESEVWEIISAHVTDNSLIGTNEEISQTIISVIGTSARVSAAKKVFDDHCKCKLLDPNGKCIAFCFHNRLKSPGVMIDCIGIETGPVVESGHIAGSRRF